VLAVARHCSRVLIVHEDSRTGGIGESLAAIIQEEAFESLDAPVRIIGALDTPVPYSPPLEDGERSSVLTVPRPFDAEQLTRLITRVEVNVFLGGVDDALIRELQSLAQRELQRLFDLETHE
jgi:hypothetical protein